MGNTNVVFDDPLSLAGEYVGEYLPRKVEGESYHREEGAKRCRIRHARGPPNFLGGLGERSWKIAFLVGLEVEAVVVDDHAIVDELVSLASNGILRQRDNEIDVIHWTMHRSI